jgi:hypothetical protein
MWLLIVQRLIANAYPFQFIIALFLLGACMPSGHASASSQELPLPTESELARNPALALDRANRVLANEPKVRATADAALVQGAAHSLPLLRRFLNRPNEDLHLETFEMIRRIGPPATMLLPTLNQMIDITTTRTLAARSHTPVVIYAILGLLVLAGALLAGYSMASGKARNWFHAFAFALTMALAIYVILDFEFPRLDLIRLSVCDQVLADVRESMNP